MWENWGNTGKSFFYYILDILFKRRAENEQDTAITERSEKKTLIT